MAVYCAKCGSEVPPDKQFCGSCGTAVAAPTPAGGYTPVAAPTPAATYTPIAAATPGAAYTPVATGVPVAVPVQVVAAPAKSGGGALKIILIVLAIFVGLGILGAGAVGFMVWRVAHAIHTSANGNNASISLPGGTITANSDEKYTASDLGTDIYPGAQSGKGSMRMTLPTGSVITAVYVTSDPKEQVVDYYKGKLGAEASVFDSGNSAVLSLQKGKQESIMVTVSTNQSQDEGKTRIAIMHTKTNKSE